MAKGPAASRLENDEGSVPIGKGHWRFAPIGVILGGLAFAYAMGWQECLSLEYLGDSRRMLKEFVAANPVLAPLGFVIAYAVIVAFSFPAASILTVISGFLFGWLCGALYAIIAATTGATMLFLATRSAFGGFLKNRAGNSVAKLARGFEKDAFGYLLALRIAPFIPFFMVNIAPALCNVRLKTFLAATLLGILPGAFAYAWLGQGLDSVLMAAKAAGRDASISDLVTPEITIAFVVLALVAVLATIVRKVWTPRAT